MLQNFVCSRGLVLSSTKNASCNQCSGGRLKYIEFQDSPGQPIRFFIAKLSSPSGSSGLIQVHYWDSLPQETAPPTSRIFLASVSPGGSFLFQPTPTRKYLSLYKSDGTNFDAICFQYVSEIRTFIPQTF